jgi:hypothetical protein
MDFGRKKKFIQEANRRSVLKGTVGLFGKWCRSQNLASDGKVTMRCINKGLKSKNTTIVRRANFARNIGGYKGAVHRRSKFGKKTKYTAESGRKSPGVSATKFPVGTVKKGLDGNNWIIIKTSKSNRWKRLSAFGKVKKKVNIKLLKSFENEIKTASKIVERYPYNDSLRAKTVRLLNNAKTKISKLFSSDNLYYSAQYLQSIASIIITITSIFTSIGQLSEGFIYLQETSATASRVLRGVSSLIKLFDRQHRKSENEINRFLKIKYGHLPKDERERESRLWRLKQNTENLPSVPKRKPRPRSDPPSIYP